MSRTPTLGIASAEAAVVAVGRASALPSLIVRSRGGAKGSFVVRSPQSTAIKAYVRVRQNQGVITDETGAAVGKVEVTGNVVSFYNMRGTRTAHALVDESGNSMRFFDNEYSSANPVGVELISELRPLVNEIAESAAPPVLEMVTVAEDDDDSEEQVVETLNHRYPTLPTVHERDTSGPDRSLVRTAEIMVIDRDRGPKDLDSFVNWLTHEEVWSSSSYLTDDITYYSVRPDGTGTITCAGNTEYFRWEPVVVLSYSGVKSEFLAGRAVVKAPDGKLAYGYFQYGDVKRCTYIEPPIDRSLPRSHPVVQAGITNAIRSGEERPETYKRAAPAQPPKKGFFSRLLGR